MCAAAKTPHYADHLATPLLVTFAGGPLGKWQVEHMEVVRGAALPSVDRLEIIEGYTAPVPASAAWLLRGATSNERYLTGAERAALEARQQPLGRPEATRAALIPIRKSPTWWQLPQDERRAVFEERSHHVATGLEYLPAVARRLHHSRDLGEDFDFLTWFEYAPEQSARFDELVRRLRSSDEWRFVEREIDIRLAR